MLRIITLSLYFCPLFSYSQAELVKTGSYDSAQVDLVFDYEGEKIIYDVLANNPYNFLKDEFDRFDYFGNKIYKRDSVKVINSSYLYTGDEIRISSLSYIHTAGKFAVVAYELMLRGDPHLNIDSYIVVIENGFEIFSFKVDFGFHWPKISPNGKYIAFSRDEESYVIGFKIYDVLNKKFIYEVDGSHHGIRQYGDLFVIAHYAKEGGYDLYCFDSTNSIMYLKHFKDRVGPIDYIETNSFTQRSNGVVTTYSLQEDFEKIPLK